ncbi:MAG: LysM peptidoglycan-binding domain-containing protein [Chloroflexota bacterium]
MTKKLTLALVLIVAVLLSACEVPYPVQQPAVTASPAGGRFTTPMATGGMAMIESFGTGTAMAQTAAAGGNGNATSTPVSGTPITPGAQATTASPDTVITFTPQVAPTTAVAPATNTVAPAITSTPVPAGFRPATYTLHSGEFPYCIARRFDVDPAELLALNGLTSGDVYMPGITLKIPQTGSFPGERALRAHPTTYTVTSSNETFYSIACLFGDVFPEAIAQANGMSVDAALAVGKVLNIP